MYPLYPPFSFLISSSLPLSSPVPLQLYLSSSTPPRSLWIWPKWLRASSKMSLTYRQTPSSHFSERLDSVVSQALIILLLSLLIILSLSLSSSSFFFSFFLVLIILKLEDSSRPSLGYSRLLLLSSSLFSSFLLPSPLASVSVLFSCFLLLPSLLVLLLLLLLLQSFSPSQAFLFFLTITFRSYCRAAPPGSFSLEDSSFSHYFAVSFGGCFLSFFCFCCSSVTFSSVI